MIVFYEFHMILLLLWLNHEVLGLLFDIELYFGKVKYLLVWKVKRRLFKQFISYYFPLFLPIPLQGI